MRIIQLTDLHVGEAGELGYGVDVRANFLNILQAAKDLKPDYLVVTGDLCMNTGSASVYAWLKEHLDATGIPYEVISGNHDHAGLLAAGFEKTAELHGEELYFFRNWAATPCLFLDTTRAAMSAAQMQWLKECLPTLDGPVLLFMHHPPMLAQMPWMDQHYPFQMREAVQEVLLAHPHPINVFCGHYHIEKTVQRRHVAMHITPSCYFQIDAHSTDFKIDHYRIALREIEIDDDTVRHSVRYY